MLKIMLLYLCRSLYILFCCTRQGWYVNRLQANFFLSIFFFWAAFFFFFVKKINLRWQAKDISIFLVGTKFFFFDRIFFFTFLFFTENALIWNQNAMGIIKNNNKKKNSLSIDFEVFVQKEYNYTIFSFLTHKLKKKISYQNYTIKLFMAAIYLSKKKKKKLCWSLIVVLRVWKITQNFHSSIFFFLIINKKKIIICIE